MKDPRALKAAQALMTSADDTEASFYDAMRHGDVDKVMACWAEDEEIACVSPGGPRTVGTVAVRAAFAATLATGMPGVRGPAAWVAAGIAGAGAAATSRSLPHSIHNRVATISQARIRKVRVWVIRQAGSGHANA